MGDSFKLLLRGKNERIESENDTGNLCIYSFVDFLVIDFGVWTEPGRGISEGLA
jgi:hypothetical protein